MFESLFQKTFDVGFNKLTIKHNIFSGVKYFYIDKQLVKSTKPMWFEGSDSHVLYMNGLKCTVHTKSAWHGQATYTLETALMDSTDPLLGSYCV